MVDGVPAFEEASLVLVCRKAYVGFLDKENFVDETVDARFYGDHDYHSIYIGFVEKVLRRS